jgi:alpha-galactosidase
MGTETAGIVSRYHRRLLVFPLVSVAWLVLAAAALGGSVSPATGNSVSPATSGGGAPTGTPEPMLAEVPYMGWNTYYGVGGVFDEGTIISVAKSLLHTGLARAGYRIVWLDFGWASGKRDRSGEIVIDRRQWPHGLRWLTDWLHEHGLLAGIYTDAGKSGCHGQGVGSLGHYQQDADRFAAWGFDAVKVDFCGAGQAGLVPKPAYVKFAKALADNSSHRTLLLNVCNFWVPGQINGTLPTLVNSAYSNYRWAPRIAQSWRTDTDIGFNKDIQFVNVLRNLDHDAAHPTAAGPGHWNDPDYLGPGLGMTSAEAQAQFSMWAILAAPLMLGSDPRTLPPATIKMLENRQVIAVDQDPLGIQGTVVEQEGSGQVWSKPLAGGAAAVALLNRGAQPLEITTSASKAGLRSAASYTIHDLWLGTTERSAGAISALVPPDSVVLYRVTPAPA